MSNSSCSRVEKKLDKCIKDAPTRGCAEAMAAVVQCRGSKICAKSCGEEYNRWFLCHGSMMSVARYTAPDGKIYKNCLSFLSDFAECDAGWRWKLEEQDPNPALK